MDTYRFRKTIHRLPGKVIHTIPLPEPQVIEGHGARSRIGAICRKCGYKQVLVVTDRTLSSMGHEKRILESLDAAQIGYTVFNDINSEPNITIIESGRAQALQTHTEAIIALGGGSVMDSCKMIAASVKMPHLPVKTLLLKFLPVPKGTLPLIMVPSTAGTGAEVTVGAVVSNDKGTKGSTVLIGLQVTHVILDSELTIHAPQSVTAACCIDALSHCIEGAISDVDLNEDDMRMSMDGIKLIFQYLPVVMQDPENIEARLALCRAAMYGGNAINTQLAGYVHAFAHSIGATYHLPHGKAIALMLLPILELQKDACGSKYAELARYCGLVQEATAIPLMTSDEQAADIFLQAVQDLMHGCQMDAIPSPVRACDHEKLIDLIAADSINYSAPVTLSNSDIQTVLNQLTPR